MKINPDRLQNCKGRIQKNNMTAQEYHIKVKLIRELDPDNKWLPLLDRGHSVSNEIYLRKALEDAQLDMSTPIPEKIISPGDKKIPAKLSAKLNKLYSSRCQLSNQYHILSTINARAKNNDKIMKIQAEMAGIWKQIDFYRATGKLITEYEDDYGLPNDKWALSAKIRSLRSSISRLKKQIKELPAGDKLEKRKNTLAENIKKLAYAEIKLDKL